MEICEREGPVIQVASVFARPSAFDVSLASRALLESFFSFAVVGTCSRSRLQQVGT